MRQDLSASLCGEAVSAIMSGDAEPAAIAAFLTALHFKGIAPDELNGALTAVIDRREAFPIPDALRPVLDTCGTGGDGSNSVNISTAAAIVVAACGVRVAKHGNRSASGNSGSAEVLDELGVKFDAEAPALLRCLEEIGITFLFAPRFHPAMKYAAPVRKILPFRTIFNLIGPLANPADPDAQLVGVPDLMRAELLRSVLRARSSGELTDKTYAGWAAMFREGCKAPIARRAAEHETRPRFRAFVVSGAGGLDEVSLAGTTHVLPTLSQYRRQLTWEPTDFGLPAVANSLLAVTGPKDSASKIREMLAGQRGPLRDVVLANAAAALKLVEKVENLLEGVARAAEAIDRGDAARLLDRWAKLSHAG